MKRLALLIFALLGAGVLLAAPAEAHATVVTSTPADGSRLAKAPTNVTIQFDENVGLGGIGYLHVTDGSGRRVDAGPAVHPGGDGTRVTDTLKSGLGDGTYTASFRVVSADSHPVAGTIRFVVGNGALARGSVSGQASDRTTSSLFDVARGVTYGGLALLGGTWLLLTVWPGGRDDTRARRLVWTGWGAAVAGAVAETLLEGPYAAGDGPGGIGRWALLKDTLRTDYGHLHSVRLLLLAATALLLARALRPGVDRARWEAVGLPLAAGLAFTVSAGGHADTTNPRWLSIVLDMAHLLAMMTWLGGLAVLVVALLPRRDLDELRAALPTFSTAAFTSVVVLAGSGTYAAWRGIAHTDAILGTTYGLLITAKVVLFVGLLALAYLSRTVVRRRFRATAFALTEDTDEIDDTEQEHLDTERLRRSVWIEVGVAAVVLALTAVLVAEPRGSEALAAQYREPVHASASLGGGASVTVTADPGTHGTVQLTVDVEGQSPTSVTASATQQQQQIGPIPVPLTKEGTGSFDGSASLPVAGRWQIDLVVTTSQFDATTADVVLTLH